MHWGCIQTRNIRTIHGKPNGNGVNGNHPGGLAEDGDLGRLNAAPNGAISNNTYRCIGDASGSENIQAIDDIETNRMHPDKKTSGLLMTSRLIKCIPTSKHLNYG
jgi:hypothetical protein